MSDPALYEMEAGSTVGGRRLEMERLSWPQPRAARSGWLAVTALFWGYLWHQQGRSFDYLHEVFSQDLSGENGIEGVEKALEKHAGEGFYDFVEEDAADLLSDPAGDLHPRARRRRLL